MIKEIIPKLIELCDLSEEEAYEGMNDIMSGEATPAQIGSILTALRIKGETVSEITGFARSMREKAISIQPGVNNMVDTCGTGGDGKNTFNISTAASFVVAGCGIPVAKHGNRSVSSKCGSADVLEALGAKVDLKPEYVKQCIEQVGIGFLFAPVFHKAMRHAISPRRELGVRTVFNILGPLTNPAGASYQVLGVFLKDLTNPVAEVLCKLGIKRALVVHGFDGMDEISITGPSIVSEVNCGVKTYVIDPLDYGIERATPEALIGGTQKDNAEIIRSILGGGKGPKRDVVLLNAAAAIVVGGSAVDFSEGLKMAADSIDSGRASNALCKFIEFTQGVSV